MAAETAPLTPRGCTIIIIARVCVQRVALQHLADRTQHALEWCAAHAPTVRTLVVCGGVAANTALRQRLEALTRERGFSLLTPPARLCTDNGVMIAWAGVERIRAAGGVLPPVPDPAFIVPTTRWSLAELTPV